MALVKFINDNEPWLDADNLNNNFDIMHPIGSIYLSVEPTNPTVYFGGTWEEFGKGKVLVGVDSNDSDFNEVEKVGGEKTHKLTADELPSTDLNGLQLKYNQYYSPATGIDGRPAAQWMDGGNAYGDKPHNILQPYITCYMWKRTK